MTDLLKQFYKNLDAVCKKPQQKEIENAYISLLLAITNENQKRA